MVGEGLFWESFCAALYTLPWELWLGAQRGQQQQQVRQVHEENMAELGFLSPPCLHQHMQMVFDIGIATIVCRAWESKDLPSCCTPQMLEQCCMSVISLPLQPPGEREGFPLSPLWFCHWEILLVVERTTLMAFFLWREEVYSIPPHIYFVLRGDP